MLKPLLATLLAILSITSYAQTPTEPPSRFERALDYCVMKIAMPHIDGKVPVFSYTETEHKTYHSPRPWMTQRQQHHGKIWADHKHFAKLDTITHKGKNYITKELYDGNTLLYQPYYAKDPIKIDSNTLAAELYEIAKYHPAMLLRYAKEHPHSTEGSTYSNPVISMMIGDAAVALTADYGTEKLYRVQITKNEEVFGDVIYTIDYRHYDTYGENPNIHYYPKLITYSKVNGITDTITMQYEGMVDKAPELIPMPDDYKVYPNEPEPEYNIITHKVNDHLYMLHLTQAESASALVVFKDFCMVIDAPLNSINGELILQEAQKIAPNKPIKYFAYGHHHPWYLGGVRPFIFNGTTILTKKENIPYIDYIAAEQHTLRPDSLRRHPTKAITETYDKKKVISDGEYEVVLYHVGMKTEHTEDYTLFYFPQEQLLIEDDMIFIKEDRPISAAGSKQAALYNTVVDLKLDVDRIIQTWPWSDRYSFKTTIPYTDLQESVKLKQDKKEQ